MWSLRSVTRVPLSVTVERVTAIYVCMGGRGSNWWRRARPTSRPIDIDAAISDFFVSRRPVVNAKRSPALRVLGVHPLRLAVLESVLTGGGIVQAVMWAARPEIDGGPHGPWITPLSEELTRGLAGLADLHDVHDVADRWLQAANWGVRSDLREELTVSLLLLAHLSRDALRVNGHLWCWTELPRTAPSRPRGRWRRLRSFPSHRIS